MRSLAVGTLIVLISCAPEAPTTVISSGYQVHSLTYVEQQVIQRAVAQETLFPDRARVTNIGSSISSEGVVVACGAVAAMEASGLYGQYRAFHGVLIDDSPENLRFAVIDIARTYSEQAAIQQVCAESGVRILEVDAISSASEDDRVGELIATERDLNSRCRGSEGADPNSTVCEQRNAVGRQLYALDWCYGRQGEYGYQQTWHRCEADSVRLAE